MTQINCEEAAKYWENERDYLSTIGFVKRDNDKILILADEEGNNYHVLTLKAAKWLKQKLDLIIESMEADELLKRQSEKLEKIEAQKEYCKNNDLPFFAPYTVCPNCKRDIWDKITLEQAKTELITGCPYCNRSYCN